MKSETNPALAQFWTRSAEAVALALGSSLDGLSEEEARNLRKKAGLPWRPEMQSSAAGLFLRQFKSPLVLILLFAGIVSAAVREYIDAGIILSILFASAVLGFFQESRAERAMIALRDRVRARSRVRRGSALVEIDSALVLPGDVAVLEAGSLIPADALVLECRDFFVNEAVLTGETYAVEKSPGILSAETPLADRSNVVFMGTNVRSGSAKVLVVSTGAETVFGRVAERLTLRPPETDFEAGIRKFGLLLTQAMTILVLLVFAVNVFAHRPVLESFLFAVALAVGLAPEMLPAIISVTLARGAQVMARSGVIVRRLNALENFGSMDVLCTDKTGTLTAGSVRLEGALDAEGRESADVLQAAFLNASAQSGMSNALDDAILEAGKAGALVYDPALKIDEIPYDFVRKLLTVVVRENDSGRLIAKGAEAPILERCSLIRMPGGGLERAEDHRARIGALVNAWAEQGYRTLLVAEKSVEIRSTPYARTDETELTLVGFLRFFDPPRPEARETLAGLTRLGVDLKIITGDHRSVASHIARSVGLNAERILTGAQLDEMHEEALWQAAERTAIFAEVDPNQKERIILALRKMGHVVGYLGDGINDAPALHAADAGISVDGAVDVAREAADFVLLEHSLAVLHTGIEEGRRTFANTLKYVFTTTSANFGNMLSMAAASFFLPYLPLLARQILLNNFLSDIPGIAIAGDRVDPEMVEKPRRWDLRFIRSFMITFGLISSVFDIITFAVLLKIAEAGMDEFRTGWFIESLLTELFIALIVRTQRPFFRSMPGKGLLISTIVITALTIAIPYLPGAGFLGFVPLPPQILGFVVIITLAYVLATELVKKQFYRLLA